METPAALALVRSLHIFSDCCKHDCPNIFPIFLQVVKLSCPDLVKVLLNKGANPDLRDPVLGLTVTHDAAREGFDDTVGVLLQLGANPNLLDDRGNLPLHLAAKEGNLEVVRLLLGFTENPSATNAQGRTARQLAQDHGKTQTAELIDEYLNNARKSILLLTN